MNTKIQAGIVMTAILLAFLIGVALGGGFRWWNNLSEASQSEGAVLAVVSLALVMIAVFRKR